MKRFALVCPLIFALACSGDKDPKGGNGLGSGNGGDGDGDVEGSGMSGDGCEEHIVKPMRVTPDMLIVLDRSGSMEMFKRWQPSVKGLEAIVDKLDNVINFGLMTFPNKSGDRQASGDTQNCTPGEIDVPVAAKNASKIDSFLSSTSSNGRTPTAATLQNVLKNFQADSEDPDQVYTGRYVLLVTDGAPNCSNPNGGGGFGGGGFGGGGAGGEPQAVDDSVAAVKALAAAGIPTYVLGYDAKSDMTLSAALDRMAQAGDTGDTSYRPIEDEASLVKEFDQIAGGAVTCDYLLDNVQKNPALVRVELDGEMLNYDDPNGWRLRQDNRTVSLQGTACDKLRTGDDHTFSVVVQCVELF
ncbi:MAG: VWA domain-containing protein [Myxococcales bacterium]